MTRPLRKRCPVCKKLRGFCEPSGDQGGTDHPSRKPWKKIENVWVCGWCAGTPTGAVGRGTVRHDHEHYSPGSAIIPLPIKDNLEGAEFSKDRVYRYRLWRHWVTDPSWRYVACFCMLNPSLANEVDLDPTLRRCKSFAMEWGCTGMVVVNMFAMVTPYPTVLCEHPNPVGEANDQVILEEAVKAKLFVVGWGAHRMVDKRSAELVKLLQQAGVKPMCLGTTKGGSPKHPLYLAKSTKLVPYELKEISP